MKKGILLLLLINSVIAHGQSLKDALYGGKLKNQPGTVIRKGDDLASKMDTARKAPTSDTTKVAVAARDTSASIAATGVDSAVVSDAGNPGTASAAIEAPVVAAAPEAPMTAAAPKDNNAAIKEYMASVAEVLKAEVLTSKKIKKGTYYATVSYTIETDGQVTVSNVLLTPENDLLQNAIKERINADAPRLNPVLSSSGAPRKVNRKYNFTLTKE